MAEYSVSRRDCQKPRRLRLPDPHREVADETPNADSDLFEASANVSAFSSKFDAFLAGPYPLTADEQAGYDLFRGKGNCNSCHLDARGTVLKSDQRDTSSAPAGGPLFTCCGSANEGLPRIPVIPFYYENTISTIEVG